MKLNIDTLELKKELKPFLTAPHLTHTMKVVNKVGSKSLDPVGLGAIRSQQIASQLSQPLPPLGGILGGLWNPDVSYKSWVKGPKGYWRRWLHESCWNLNLTLTILDSEKSWLSEVIYFEAKGKQADIDSLKRGITRVINCL